MPAQIQVRLGGPWLLSSGGGYGSCRSEVVRRGVKEGRRWSLLKGLTLRLFFGFLISRVFVIYHHLNFERA